MYAVNLDCTHLVIDQRYAEEVREEEQNFVLRIVLLRRRNVSVDAVYLLNLAGRRTLPADASSSSGMAVMYRTA